MSAAAIVWIITALGLVVLLALAAREMLSAVREGKRAAFRVKMYRDLPVVTALVKGQGDAKRLQASLQAVDPLLVRAQTALATIRRGPFPPEVVSAVRRVRAVIAVFRR